MMVYRPTDLSESRRTLRLVSHNFQLGEPPPRRDRDGVVCQCTTAPAKQIHDSGSRLSRFCYSTAINAQPAIAPRIVLQRPNPLVDLGS